MSVASMLHVQRHMALSCQSVLSVMPRIMHRKMFDT